MFLVGSKRKRNVFPLLSVFVRFTEIHPASFTRGLQEPGGTCNSSLCFLFKMGRCETQGFAVCTSSTRLHQWIHNLHWVTREKHSNAGSHCCFPLRCDRKDQYSVSRSVGARVCETRWIKYIRNKDFWRICSRAFKNSSYLVFAVKTGLKASDFKCENNNLFPPKKVYHSHFKQICSYWC